MIAKVHIYISRQEVLKCFKMGMKTCTIWAKRLMKKNNQESITNFKTEVQISFLTTNCNSYTTCIPKLKELIRNGVEPRNIDRSWHRWRNYNNVSWNKRCLKPIYFRLKQDYNPFNRDSYYSDNIKKLSGSKLYYIT